jgi:hypothetical protein
MTVRCHFVCRHFPNIRGLSCKYEKCWFWLIKIKHSGLDIIWQISLYLIHAPPSKCQFQSEQLEAPASEARIDATAQGIASMLCAHGPEVEWLICTIWEARPSPSQFLRNRLTRNCRGCRHSQFNNWWFHVRRMKREIYSVGETRLKVLSSRSWGAQKPSMNQGNFKRKGGSRTLYNFLASLFPWVL